MPVISLRLTNLRRPSGRRCSCISKHTADAIWLRMARGLRAMPAMLTICSGRLPASRGVLAWPDHGRLSRICLIHKPRIAMVHSDNRLASIIAMGIFATGVAASVLLILAHDRPFTGEISIRPDALLQVMPEI